MPTILCLSPPTPAISGMSEGCNFELCEFVIERKDFDMQDNCTPQSSKHSTFFVPNRGNNRDFVNTCWD